MVSCIGYTSVKIDPDILESKLKILLDVKTHELDSVLVNSEPCSWSRKKMLNIFKSNFVGTTRIAKACEIVNPDKIYLYYNSTTHILHAKCTEPIIIRNKMLGYLVYFDIDYFEWNNKWMKYRGAILFEELKFSREKEYKCIERRRRYAYQGTPMHFVRSMYSKTTGENGFFFYTKEGGKLFMSDVLMEFEGERYLVSKEPLIVKYRQENASTTLNLHKERLKLYEVGYFDSEEVEFTGFLGIFRVGDMLPFDYKEN